MSPICSVDTVEKVLKPAPTMVTSVPVGPLAGEIVTVARGISWVTAVVAVVSEPSVGVYLNSAVTELVDGIGAFNGTVKEPVMLPEESGVKVATVSVVVP
jgi:hypothetical protein